jgi:hypothetical protein
MLDDLTDHDACQLERREISLPLVSPPSTSTFRPLIFRLLGHSMNKEPESTRFTVGNFGRDSVESNKHPFCLVQATDNWFTPTCVGTSERILLNPRFTPTCVGTHPLNRDSVLFNSSNQPLFIEPQFFLKAGLLQMQRECNRMLQLRFPASSAQANLCD